ncbi:hypothetical protein J6590_007098 [Homalodisca vitripennis]|nr:hypothetical protein J6590_007098 [Homalodisca vitripennis]
MHCRQKPSDGVKAFTKKAKSPTCIQKLDKVTPESVTRRRGGDPAVTLQLRYLAPCFWSTNVSLFSRSYLVLIPETQYAGIVPLVIFQLPKMLYNDVVYSVTSLTDLRLLILKLRTSLVLSTQAVLGRLADISLLLDLCVSPRGGPCSTLPVHRQRSYGDHPRHSSDNTGLKATRAMESAEPYLG